MLLGASVHRRTEVLSRTRVVKQSVATCPASPFSFAIRGEEAWATFKEAESFPPLNYEKKGGTVDLAFWRAPERLLLSLIHI